MKIILLALTFMILNVPMSFSQNGDECPKTELIPILVKNNYGYCNKQGKIIIPAIYDEAEPFIRNVLYYTFEENNIYGNENYATVKKDGEYYRIDKSGVQVCKFNPQGIDEAMAYQEPQMVTFKHENKFGVKLDTTIVIQSIYDEVYHPDFYDKSIPFRVKKDGKYGIVDLSGRVLIQIIYDEVFYNYGEYFNIDLVKVELKKRVFYVDYCGNKYLK